MSVTTTPPNILCEKSILKHSSSAQLYLLTNDDEFALLYDKLQQALATGVVGLLQIRRKYLSTEQVLAESEKIVLLAKRYNVPVVMNDDVVLAEKLGIGVHLGQGDGSVQQARERLGEQAIIGRTCHGNVDWVRQAKADGASYVAMGAVFPSPTKPNAQVISRLQLQMGLSQGIDGCVIGGINLDNVGQLAGLPIRYVAVVSDVMGCAVEGVAKRCYQWQQALQDLS